MPGDQLYRIILRPIPEMDDYLIQDSDTFAFWKKIETFVNETVDILLERQATRGENS